MANTEFFPPKGNGNNGPGATAIVSYPMLRYYKITSGDNIYHCYASVGATLTSKQWMVAQENSGTTDIISVKFPQDDNGNENSGFIFDISSDSSEANIATKLATYTYGP